MVSKKSLITFFYINGFLFGLSYFNNYLLRNYILMLFIYHGTKNKDWVAGSKKITFKDHLHVFSSTFIEIITSTLCAQLALRGNKPVCNWIYFLPILFLFEVILDLFHYTFHRLLHTPKLYFIHKKHHYYTNPAIINTYFHSPLDVILTISIPTLLALKIIPVSFTNFQMNLVLVYKSFIEISGHTGKKLAPSSCFPMCVWLPRALGIELYTEDHHRHHSRNNCNYSKRFSIWDKLFGTYISQNRE